MGESGDKAISLRAAKAGAATRDGNAQPFDVIVIAASLGGTFALSAVLGCLPQYFPVPVMVVAHRAAQAGGQLALILAHRCGLSVAQVDNRTELRAGTVGIAPADRQLEFSENAVRAVAPGRSHDADALFRSAAASFGARVLAVVLTGRLDDGALGVRAVKRAGGRVLVQDPADAAAPGMPGAAMATGCVDFVVPLDLIGPALIAFALAPGAAELLRVPLPAWADLDESRDHHGTTRIRQGEHDARRVGGGGFARGR